MSDTANKRRSAFSPVTMIVIVLVSVFSFAAFLTLSAFEPELSSGRDGRAHALSRSATGFAAAVSLARAQGIEVTIGRTAFDAERFESLVVLTPERQLTHEDLANASGATTLVVLPKWAVAPYPLRRDWVARGGALDPEFIASRLREVAPTLSIMRADGVSRPLLSFPSQSLFGGEIEELQTIVGKEVTPVVTDQAGRVVLGQISVAGYENLYILADPDFLNTQGLRELATANAGMAMINTLRLPDEPIVFDVTLNGLGSPKSPLRLAFQPPLLGATIALTIAALLLGWRGAVRAGPSALARRAIALGKSALADNSAALVRLAKREHKLGPDYANLIAAETAKAVVGARVEESDARSLLDRIGAAHGLKDTYSTLAAQAAAAKTRTQMLEAARKLHAWKEEIIRATR